MWYFCNTWQSPDYMCTVSLALLPVYLTLRYKMQLQDSAINDAEKLHVRAIFFFFLGRKMSSICSTARLVWEIIWKLGRCLTCVTFPPDMVPLIKAVAWDGPLKLSCAPTMKGAEALELEEMLNVTCRSDCSTLSLLFKGTICTSQNLHPFAFW